MKKNILGLDYGKSKVGVAISEGSFATPLKVVRYEDLDGLLEKIGKIVNGKRIEKIVVGVSSGKMAEESKEFAKELGYELGIKVEIHDEVLSTKMAQKKAIEAGIRREKRQKMEDAFAAALILENYLENE